MVTLTWEVITFSSIILLLGALYLYLWRRSSPGPQGRTGRDGLAGRDGRDGTSLTGATADLIIELSHEVDCLKKRVHELEIGAEQAHGRIVVLQTELSLANSEVCALEELVREQAGRISDLRSENEQLRQSMAMVMRKTDRLECTEPDTL